MTYQLTSYNTIIRLSDNAYIPTDVNNMDYRKYLEWVSKGNTPLPAVDIVSAQPNYKLFLDQIISSPLYQKILAQSVTSPTVNTYFTATMGALILASTGAPNSVAIESGINSLLDSMTLAPGDIPALQSLLTATKLNTVITLMV